MSNIIFLTGGSHWRIAQPSAQVDGGDHPMMPKWLRPMSRRLQTIDTSTTSNAGTREGCNIPWIKMDIHGFWWIVFLPSSQST